MAYPGTESENQSDFDVTAGGYALDNERIEEHASNVTQHEKSSSGFCH